MRCVRPEGCHCNYAEQKPFCPFWGGQGLVKATKYDDQPPPPAIPQDREVRKEAPLTRGLLDYFPLACLAVANCSYVGNQQHNPGEEMHWAREKSTDHADCIGRHLLERGTRDNDGVRHSAKVAWRALALLQMEIEADGGVI